MVNVILETIPITGMSLAGQFAATKLNDSLERCVIELRTHVMGKKCALHPRLNQEMTIYSDSRSFVHIDVTSCCCDNFRDKLQFVPKDPLKYAL